VTYANIALVRSRLVHGVTPGTRAPLGPLLFDSARAGRLAGRRLDEPGRTSARRRSSPP
jgi:MurNAc alpha-1-phosphate uridylyltransferase